MTVSAYAEQGLFAPRKMMAALRTTSEENFTILEMGPDRIVALTGIGTSESIGALSTLERMGHSVLLGEPYKDKTRQEDLIRASSLRWTFARPVILTNGKRTETYKVLTDPKEWRMGLISRRDVADFLVKAATDEAMVGQAPVLTR